VAKKTNGEKKKKKKSGALSQWDRQEGAKLKKRDKEVSKGGDATRGGGKDKKGFHP